MIRAMRLCTLVLALVITSISVQAQSTVTLNNDEICQGNSKTLSTLVNGSFQTFHSWSANGQVISTNYNVSVSPAVTTVYTLDYTDNAGARKQQSLTLTVYETPVFDIPDNQTICSGNAVPLTATMRNGSGNTIINWRCDNDGSTYTNGANAGNATSTSVTYVYTASVRNHSKCPAAPGKSFFVTVNIKPTGAVIRRINDGIQCKAVSFNLNNFITFDVTDNYGNRAPGGTICNNGQINWYTAAAGPAPIDPVRTINVPGDETFYADYNNVEICYTNECLSFFHPFSGEARMPVSVHISDAEFSLTDNTPCLGEPLIADYMLKVKDDPNQTLSPCDTITELIIISGDRTKRIRQISNSQWQVEYSPLFNNDDTIKVKLMAKSGVSATYSHAIRRPTDPYPHGADVVCKGEDVTFYITAYHCDRINNITFSGLESYTVDKIPEPENFRYRIVVHDVLDDVLNFNYHIDFYSNYESANTFTTGTYSLQLHNYLPYMYVFVNDVNPYNANPNLCLGDSLTYSIYPALCDTLTGSTWTCTNTTLPARQATSTSYIHSYVVQPTATGSYDIEIKVSYRRPTETTDRTYTFTFPIKVVERPKIFINGQDRDTTAFCYDQGKEIDLAVDNIIDYNAVHTPFFPDEYPPGLSAISPFSSGDFNVQATYRRQCSEMYSGTAYGVLRVISDRSNISGALNAPSEFCVLDGIDIPSSEAEGTALIWTYNGQAISFPYMVDPGTYLLQVTASNSCIPVGIPDFKFVTVVDQTKVEAMPDTNVCPDATVTLYTLPGAIGELVWSKQGTPLLSTTEIINETTTYTVTATNTCGSASDEAIIFRIKDALAQTRGDTGVCYNDVIPLNVVGVGTFTWYNTKDTTTALEGSPPMVRITQDERFKVTAFNGCSPRSDFLNVRPIALPFVEVAADSTLCYGVAFKPEVRRSVGNLTWNPDKVESVTGPMTIIVTATVAEPRCGSYSDTLHLDAYPALALQPATLPSYKRLKPYTLLFETLHGEPPVHYTMQGSLPPGLMYESAGICGLSQGAMYTAAGICGTPVLGPGDYNTYRITVLATDGHNCEVANTYTLEPAWSAATAFMPAENDANATFLPGYQIEIYTRNGILIYKGNDGWKGISNGSPVAAGTYFYKASAVFDGTPKQFTGYITVMYR